MKKFFFVLIYVFISNIGFSQITLTHNVGNTPIKTDWESCGYDEEYYARIFKLSDFGISNDEQFILRSAQVAVSNAQEGNRIMINIFAIDENFPTTQPLNISYGNTMTTPFIGDNPEILNLNFYRPIVIPSKVERILVEVTQLNQSAIGTTKFLIAGTESDNDKSWFKGCNNYYPYLLTDNMDSPKPNANFFINVTGEKRSIINTDDNITLSHNIGDDAIKTQMYSCSSSYQFWARKFILKDFGISENEEYIIRNGSVAITNSSWGARVQFNIYKVDDNFPSSFKEDDLIGSSQVHILNSTSSSGLKSNIHLVEFQTPIIVPSDVEEILVEVHKGVSSNSSSTAFIGGTKEDKDDSWYKGCSYTGDRNTYSTLNSMNFFITVNGEAQTILPFEITNDNNCSNFSNNLSLTNQSEIQSVVWNFDDPSSGADNTSTNIDVNHQFTAAGIYNVTATVTHIDNTVYTIPKEIEIFEAPNINQKVELKQCDNSDINGFSFFNLNEVKEKIITNPENYIISFYEEKVLAENRGTAISNSTNYQNEVVSNDIVWARVENTNGCYEVSEVNLLVSTTEIPLNFSKSFYQCDDGTNTTDGIATFDFSAVTNEITNIFPANQQLEITYYQNEADALAEENNISNISNYQNTSSPNQQTIYIRVDSKVDNSCLGLGAHITLNVEKVPVANPVTLSPECDNDKDGLFSFDTSNIQATLIGNQTNVAVSYFDENDIQLSSPLPNPFVTASQKITARVVNTNSQDSDGQCFNETEINFIVNTVPTANTINVQEACDDDFDGIVAFDTSLIESTIVGSQTGLVVKYFDENNNALPSPLPNPFNTFSQTIRVRLENPIYDLCFEETTVSFVVNEKPSFSLKPDDIICMGVAPKLEIKAENPDGNYNYTWRDENNDIVGVEQAIEINKGGVYKVIATSDKGCDSDEQTITIKESSISTISIDDVDVQDDSDNNFIKVNSTNLGLGDYEFRLLDSNSNIIYDYQDSADFQNLDGGIYILEVNDKNSCGVIPFEISLISFPSFFTPNGDGKNDYWQIKGLNNSFYKSGIIKIFNRYGIQITEFTINDIGWDGTYNGKELSSNDFWFQVILINQNDDVKTRDGNFSLIRN